MSCLKRLSSLELVGDGNGYRKVLGKHIRLMPTYEIGPLLELLKEYVEEELGKMAKGTAVGMRTGLASTCKAKSLP